MWYLLLALVSVCPYSSQKSVSAPVKFACPPDSFCLHINFCRTTTTTFDATTSSQDYVCGNTVSTTDYVCCRDFSTTAGRVSWVPSDKNWYFPRRGETDADQHGFSVNLWKVDDKPARRRREIVGTSVDDDEDGELDIETEEPQPTVAIEADTLPEESLSETKTLEETDQHEHGDYSLPQTVVQQPPPPFFKPPLPLQQFWYTQPPPMYTQPPTIYYHPQLYPHIYPYMLPQQSNIYQHPPYQYSQPGLVQQPLFPGTVQPQQHAGTVQPQLFPGTLQPQQLPGTLQPQLFPGTLQPQQLPGTVHPQQLPGTLHPQQLPGTLQPQQLPGSVQPQQLLGSVQPQQLLGSVQPQQLLGSVQPQQLPESVQPQALPNPQVATIQQPFPDVSYQSKFIVDNPSETAANPEAVSPDTVIHFEDTTHATISEEISNEIREQRRRRSVVENSTESEEMEFVTGKATDFKPAAAALYKDVEERRKRQAVYSPPKAQLPGAGEYFDDLPSDCGTPYQQTHSRIITKEYDYGANMPPGVFPWHVAIIDGKSRKYLCGGAILSRSWVMTVAHCVDYLWQLLVRIQDHDLALKEHPPAYDVEVARVEMHPEYRAKDLQNDIALLRLKYRLRFEKLPQVAPVCIPDSLQEVEPRRCAVPGWGQVQATKDKLGNRKAYSWVLRAASLNLLKYDVCEGYFRRVFGHFFKMPQGFVCAIGESGKDSCFGDGGGALVCPVSYNNKQTAVGLVSWGVGCGQHSIPAAYTDVAAFSPWIRAVVRGHIGKYKEEIRPLVPVVAPRTRQKED